jgi:hypothetical protein
MSEQMQNEITTPDALYAKMLPIAMARLSGPGVSDATVKELAHGLASECVAECGRLGLFERRVEEVPPAVRVASSLEAVNPNAVGSLGAPAFAEQGPVPGAPAPAVMPIGAPNQPAVHYNHMSQPVAGAGQPNAAASIPIAQPAGYAVAPQPPPPQRGAPQPAVVQSDVRWYPPHLKHLYEPSSPSAAQAMPQAPMPMGVNVPQPAQVVPGGVGGGAVLAAQPDVGGQRIVTATGDGFMPPAPAGLMNKVVHISTPAGHSALGLNGVISEPEQKPNQYQQVVAPQGERVITPVGAGGSMYVPENIVK